LQVAIINYHQDTHNKYTWQAKATN